SKSLLYHLFQSHKYKRLPPWRFAGNDLQDFLMSKRSQIQPEQNDYVDPSVFQADIRELDQPAKLVILRPTQDWRQFQKRLSLPFISMNLI
uniref:Cytochrome P450 n=1 Tax=Bursaphelenchus xylophilus TaxID=6326 RepID=A0A1I7SI00_BURXY